MPELFGVILKEGIIIEHTDAKTNSESLSPGEKNLSPTF